MRFLLILAHGQELIPVFEGIVIGANVAAIMSIVIAKRKRKDERSTTGLALAAIALLVGAWTFPLAITGIVGIAASLAMLAPVPISVIGGILCARKIKNA